MYPNEGSGQPDQNCEHCDHVDRGQRPAEPCRVKLEDSWAIEES